MNCMRLAVTIDGKPRPVSCRAGLRNISRAVVGAVVDAGAGELSSIAHEGAVRIADGFSSYAATVGGRERFRVAVLD